MNPSIKRSASAEWKNGLKDGQGTISTESGVLSKTQYSFSTRFEKGQGTNPEELIAAAHAGCFTMALSAQLEKEGVTGAQLQTTATVTMEKVSDGFAISNILLHVTAKIANADKTLFDKAAHNAKVGCPVSKLFNATITLETELNA